MMKIFLSLLLISSIAKSSTEWMVVAINGKENFFLSKGKKSDLHVGEKLSLGNEIQTGNQSKVKLVFADGSVLVVAENSQVALNSSENDKTKLLEVKTGKFRAKIEKETAGLFKFKTPSTVSGIRGTEFFMSAAADKEIICVLEGEVETLETQTKTKFSLKKNQGWLKATKGLSSVIQTSEEQRKEWLQATSL